METITLNAVQQRHLDILVRLAAGRVSICQAAELMGCSERTVRRRTQRLRSDGPKGLIHGNKGKEPIHKTKASLVGTIKELTGERGRYRRFNTSHMAEMLALHEGLYIGRSTLDRLLKLEGIRKRRRSGGAPVRRRRERYPREGELLQIDGSLHKWVGDRGPKMCLLGGIDDATSKIVSLIFRPTEDQVGYLLLMRNIATDPRYGLPMAFYHDKHTILRSPKEQTIDDELAGREPMSQIQQVLHRLGVEGIPAHSPQAKGRIERMWQTLQDRLINEMSLTNISTIEEANAFLPGFIQRWNAQFVCEAADSHPAWVPLEENTDLAYLFAAWDTRTVRADHTLCWKGKTFLIQRSKGERSLDGHRVQVHSTPEGETFIYSGEARLSHTQVPPRPKSPPARKARVADTTTKQPYDPAPYLRKKVWLHGSPAAV